MAGDTPQRPFSWERQYYETVSETDDVQLAVRVKTLEGTLLLRLLDLTGDLEDEEELRAVEGALHALAVLKRERGIA